MNSAARGSVGAWHARVPTAGWDGTALLVLLAATTACRPAPPPGREFDLRGHVLDVDRARSTVLFRHHDIPGFVPALTMPFRVKEVRLLDGRQRGDLVKARPWPEGGAAVNLLRSGVRYAGCAGGPRQAGGHRRHDVAVRDRRPGGRRPVARHFGLVVVRDDPATIAHTLRTALGDRQGRLVRVYNGCDWTPVELVAEIGKLVGDSSR